MAKIVRGKGKGVLVNHTFGPVGIPKNPQVQSVKSAVAAKNMQYPGQKMGLSLQEVKNFVDNQVKAKGYSETLSVGLNSIKIDLPGDAGFILGIAFNAPIDAGTGSPAPVNGLFDFNVNNTIVHESIDCVFATNGAQGALYLQPYFGVNMPLAGQDTVKLNLTAATAPTTNLNIIVYYK